MANINPGPAYQAKAESPHLMEHIRELENKNSVARGEYILSQLKVLGIEPTIQERRRPKIKNIIVDFAPGPEKKPLLFSAHYDVVKGSPGANDNASGVSVLLGLCQEMKNTRSPIRIVFFDREEAWFRTPIIRLGLLGSLYYTWKIKRKTILAVINLEFCGSGDCLTMWPIKRKETNLPIFKLVKKAAERLKLPCKSAHIPWLVLSSDHLSFRLLGVSNALTLSLLPSDQISSIEKFLAELNFRKLITNRRRYVLGPLKYVHTNQDVSSRLNESSLRLMLTLLQEVIQENRDHAQQ